MKAIIVGAGNVGTATAEAASRGNDVLIIEKNPAHAENVKNTLQVSILLEDGSNPRTLREAIDRMDADIIFSAVPDDGINVFICATAKGIRPEMTTVACVRNPDYIFKNMPGVDMVVSPETVTAERVVNCAMLENAVSFERVGIADLCLTTFKVENGHDIVGKTVMDLDLPPGCTVVSLVSAGETDLTVATAEVKAGDRITVLGTWDAAIAFNRLIGIRKDTKEFVILGAGAMARAVAKAINDCPGKQFVKMIDSDLALCKAAARELREVIVVNGNTVDPVFLRGESVDRADVLISVADMDERNLLASMTALRFGIRKIITRYNTDEYEEIFKYAGIESVIGYHRVIVNEVTKCLAEIQHRKGEGVMIMDDPGDRFFGMRIDPSSPLAGRFLGDIVLPEEISIPALVRDGGVIFTGLGTKVLRDDLVLVCTHGMEDYRLSTILGRHAPELRGCWRA